MYENVFVFKFGNENLQRVCTHPHASEQLPNERIYGIGERVNVRACFVPTSSNRSWYVINKYIYSICISEYTGALCWFQMCLQLFYLVCVTLERKKFHAGFQRSGHMEACLLLLFIQSQLISSFHSFSLFCTCCRWGSLRPLLSTFFKLHAQLMEIRYWYDMPMFKMQCTI